MFPSRPVHPSQHLDISTSRHLQPVVDIQCFDPAQRIFPKETTAQETHNKNVSNLMKRKAISGDEAEEIKLEKLKEQTKALRLDNFKKQLEIFELEQRLGLIPSKLSREFS